MSELPSDCYEVTFNKVYQRIEVKRSPVHEFNAFELIPGMGLTETGSSRGPLHRNRFLVILSWSADVNYIRPQLRFGRANNKMEVFRDSRDALREYYKTYGVPLDKVPQGIQTGQQRVLVAELEPADKVRLCFDVNTEDANFIKHGNLKPGDESCLAAGVRRTVEGLSLDFHLFGYALVAPSEGMVAAPPVEQFSRAAPSPVAAPAPAPGLAVRHRRVEANREIELTLAPVTKLQGYEGYVGLDLGTTSSTLACMAGGISDVEEIEVVEVGALNEGSLISTAIRIQQYVQPPDLKTPPTARWKFGRDALTDSNEGILVLGAKRLLADPRSDQPFQVYLNRQKVAIPKLLPAELFIAAMFKGFARKMLGVAVKSKTAITHPTTFSSRELGQLKQAMHDGWRRSWGATEYVPVESRDKSARGADDYFLTIDEASAAAIFFIYKDILCAPGRMRKFHYIYPRGLNLLLYDCGGGTTDVALVQVKPSGTDSGRIDEMTITVMGRTGKRDFGGDNITSAVFQLIKARLATLLSDGHVRFDPNPTEVASQLRRDWAAFDRYVPTVFSPNLDTSEDNERMQATLNLWQIAETVKKKLTPGAFVSVKDEEGINLLKDLPLVQGIAKANNIHPSKVEELWEEVDVSTEWVNELIAGDVSASVEVANEMLQEKLYDVDPESEVHRVYVVGNASRYHLILETLKKELNVRFIDERLIFDEENLKKAVAKGAVVARRMVEQLTGVNIVFDNRLSQRLPYDIIYEDQSVGPRAVFREYTPYSDLEPAHIDASGKDGQGRRQLYLYRRWPGARTEKKAYYSFTFNANVSGPVEVSYDRAKHCFWMKAEGNVAVQPARGEEMAEEAIYRSPVQLGDIKPQNPDRNE